MLNFRYGLTSQRINEFRAEFYKFTCNKNKDQDHLQTEEVLYFLRKQAFDLKSSYFQEMNRDIFKEKTKQLFNCWEVITLIGRLSLSEEVVKEIRRVFDYFDVGHKNKINAMEFKTGFDRLNENVTCQEVNQIFVQFDLDKDGFIGFQQFLSSILER